MPPALKRFYGLVPEGLLLHGISTGKDNFRIIGPPMLLTSPVRMRHTSNTLQFFIVETTPITSMHIMEAKIYHSISEVPKQQWNRILNNRSVTYSHEFWEILEQSKLNDFSYHYVLFFNAAGEAVALTSFYTITTDIAIFAPNRLRSLLQYIRKTFPNFLKFKMLECGTPITLNGPFVASDRVTNAETIDSLVNILFRTAKEQGHFLIVLRDFEPHADSMQSEFQKFDFHFVDSLPTTYLEIAWSSPDEYISSMKSYYRSKLLKHLRINREQGIWHELRENFDDLADELCHQWLVVHNHASEYQREILTPDFYKEFSLKLGTRSKVLLFYRKEELVGHALLLEDGDLLRWLYFGRAEASNDSLYIYVAQKVIETAISLRASRLELGLTTYPIKKDLGAYMSPIKLALRSPTWWINPYVGLVYPLLNHTPKIQNKDIFKTE